MSDGLPEELKKFLAEEVERRVAARLAEMAAAAAPDFSGMGPLPAPREGPGGSKLADIIDAPAIQALMDDFYQLARIPMSIIDLDGRVLVGVGWQKVCMEFHRAHPEACKHCIESDTLLTAGIPPGEFRLYKCKNNMWDIATPIMIGDHHVGNIISGQFFFEDEPMDEELFRTQAEKYGFAHEEYLAAMQAVPRLSRQAVSTGMAFFLKLAQMLSQLSISNLDLARAVAERDLLMASLRDSREDLNRAQFVARIGSWRLDVRRNQLSWSDETYRLFGIPPGTPMTYEKFLAAVHPEDREFVHAAWQAALRGEPYEIEHRIVVEGKIRWVSERAELEFDREGKLRGGFGTVQDISDRTQAEEEREQLITDLDRSNRELEQFAYVASHDLQSPLRSVTGFLHLLSRRYQGKLDPEADEFIAYAVEGAERMHRLINDILAFSRVGTRGHPFEQVASEEPLAKALDNLRAEIEESGAEVTFGKLPVVTGDRNQLAQLFQNLVGNAIKYRKEGEPPRIHLAAEGKGAEWEFRVRDNGIGFDPLQAERIFQIFQRLHTSSEYPGTGIGLAICRKIVERHGGRMWVETEPGQGSTFYFTLPKA
jgi:PAS domain S-box-containing protein